MHGTGQRMPAWQGELDPYRSFLFGLIDRNDHMTMVRVHRSKRRVMGAPFGSWGAQTLIAGLSSEVLITLQIIKSTIGRKAFAAYVERVAGIQTGAGYRCHSRNACHA